MVTRSIDVQTIESSFETPSAREPAILDEFLVPAEEEQTEKMVTEYEILNIVEPSQGSFRRPVIFLGTVRWTD